jgi:hypothetical protein
MTKYTEQLSYNRCLPVPLFTTTLPNPGGTTLISEERQDIKERPTSSALGDDTTNGRGLSSLPLLVDWSVGDDTTDGGGLSSLPLLVDGAVGVGGERVHCSG